MARKGDGIFKRGKVWRLDCYINGIRYQISLGKGINRTTAAEIASTKRSAILKGEAGIWKKKDILFEKAKTDFLAAAEVNTRPNTLRGYKTHLENMTDTFKGKHLREISPFLIESYKKKRLAAGVTVAFNRELGTLKTLFNWAIDKNRFEGINPTRKIKRVLESKGRERALSIEEENRLLNSCTPAFQTLLMCGIYAGLRIPSEVLNLKWADIELGKGLLTVQGAYAKNGKTEVVPLTSRLRDALAKLRRLKNGDLTGPEEHVFTTQDGRPYKSIQNIFRTAARRAKLSDISPHVCRHTFATRLAEGGVDLRTIQELGRWASLSMVQRYSNIGESHKVEAIEKLSQTSGVGAKPEEITNRIKRPVRYTKDSVSA